MTSQALIRPAWTPATIALMVLGFIVYWPLGLAALAYIPVSYTHLTLPTSDLV